MFKYLFKQSLWQRIHDFRPSNPFFEASVHPNAPELLSVTAMPLISTSPQPGQRHCREEAGQRPEEAGGGKRLGMVSYVDAIRFVLRIFDETTRWDSRGCCSCEVRG